MKILITKETVYYVGTGTRRWIMKKKADCDVPLVYIYFALQSKICQESFLTKKSWIIVILTL